MGSALMVALLAVGLIANSAAARSNALIPLVWIHAILPGLASAWVLSGMPGWRRSSRIPPRAAARA